CPLAVTKHGDGAPAILPSARKHAMRRGAGAPVAVASLDVAGGLPVQKSRRGLLGGHPRPAALAVLPSTRAIAAVERSHDGSRVDQWLDLISIGGARRRDGLAIAPALQAQTPGPGATGGVVAGFTRERPGLAQDARFDDDDTRVETLQAGVVETKAGHRAWPGVGVHHVGPHHHAPSEA